jgi:NAD(P)-dependent dehydrogenase (short-subunit alcohol dehydrogenase family)
MNRLLNKIAIVTGAADGIGHAISAAMAREGAFVFVADIDDAKGQAFAAELTAKGLGAQFVHCDVSSDADIAGLVETAIAAKGRVDVLVNNAAIAIGGMPVHEMTDEQWHRLIAVNLTSVFRGCKHVLPHMIKQQGGAVINMASARSSSTAMCPAMPILPDWSTPPSPPRAGWTCWSTMPPSPLVACRCMK